MLDGDPLIYLVSTYQNQAKDSHWIGHFKTCVSPDFGVILL